MERKLASATERRIVFMRQRQAVLILATMVLGVMLASGGVAVAQDCTTNPCTGTNGPDNLTGSNDNDQMDALAGNDVLWAKAGDDVLNGHDGDDALYADGGGGGSNIPSEAWADAGKDTANGGPGND